MKNQENRVVVALADMGCLQNTLPVAKFLHQQGNDVVTLIKDGSIAQQKIDSSEVSLEGIPVVDGIEKDDVLLTCLPVWSMELVHADTKVVLIAENALSTDQRFEQWLEHENITVVGLPVADILVVKTGLPAVAKAAQAIKQVDLDTQEVLSLKPGAFVLSVAFPGDEAGCDRMFTTLITAKIQRPEIFIFGRTHPKLEESARQRMADIIEKLGGYNLLDANANFGPYQQMHLGHAGMFVCDWNSTMALQAAAAGIPVGLVPPADQDPIEWMANTSLLRNGNAVPFLGVHPFWDMSKITPMKCNAQDPVETIAEVVLKMT